MIESQNIIVTVVGYDGQINRRDISLFDFPVVRSLTYENTNLRNNFKREKAHSVLLFGYYY